jgi:hypothetical protein
VRFRIKPHSDPLGNRTGVKIVEVYDDGGRFIGMVTPGRPGHEDTEIRFLTKHFVDAEVDRAAMDAFPGSRLPAAVNVRLARSRDPVKGPDPEAVAETAAYMNLQRVMLADKNRKRGILVKRTSYEILPSEITPEEAAKMANVEILAVAESLPTPEHLKPSPRHDQSAHVGVKETAVDGVIMRCEACDEEATERAWSANANKCPNCQVPLAPL